MDTQSLQEIDFTKQENTLTNEKTLTTNTFVNRKRIAGNENRKTIIIRGQSANTMDVDILDCGMTKPDEESDGTPITAEVMQEFRDVIEQSDQNSQKAYNISKTAYENSVSSYNISQSANTTATSANNTSLAAEQIATEAKNKALEVEGKLADRGAIIKVNGVPQTEISFSSDPQTQINSKLTNSTSEIKTNVLSIVYPIGSIYMSVNSTNPSTLFGGTWEQLQDRFLLGAGTSYSAGATGGESTHVLTVSEMPTHTHIQNSHFHTVNSALGNFNLAATGNGKSLISSTSGFVSRSSVSGGSSTYPNTYSRDDGNKSERSLMSFNHEHTANATTAINNNAGDGAAHNNMPPYLVVYMWKRIV